MDNKYKNAIRKIFRILLYVFAIVGLAFTGVFFAMKLHLTDVKGSIDSRNSFFNENKNTENRIKISNTETYDWETSEEWLTLKEALVKDKDLLLRISQETDIPARIIASSIVSEQFRFFTSNRESFKKYFEPLKVLGTYTQFSYGISGIKMETAKIVEENLKNKQSPFYLGRKYEDVLNYNSIENIDNQRLARFTDSHDHYYSYLYTALYLKQIMKQWEDLSYPIGDRPEVLATLFNLGFSKSVPKLNPEVGGSTITIGGKDYTFGGLAYEFYYSGELSDIFPIDVQ